jgi:cell division protease FtsH
MNVLPFLRGTSVIPGLIITTLLVLCGAVINFATGGPQRWALLGAALVLPAPVIWLGLAVLRDRMDSRIERLLTRPGRGLAVAQHDFPDYRFVDAFKAVEEELGSAVTLIESAHQEDLGTILTGSFYAAQGFPVEPARTARAVAPDREEFFPTDRFWIVPGGTGPIVRLRLIEHAYAAIARLEVAAVDATIADRTVSAIRDRSVAGSIYRGRTLEVSFTPGVKDRAGQIDQTGRVKVDFRRAPAVEPDAVVLDPRAWPIIEHSLVDLHRNGAALAASGVAVKRGLLFYGPPGTGKSITCRYVASLLPGTTMVYSTGASLHHVASTFNLARMLQPAVIVLEDVDLVFSSRDINVFGSALGDLFDQIDLVGDEEHISVILTTNAIERLEAALKDRPGRVSQCVYFGPPSDELRRQFLETALRDHDASRVDLTTVVRATDGSTQAFLKELVNRALQFSVEQGRSSGTRIAPATEDFEAALSEIRAFDGKATRVITGFRIESDR